MIGSGLLGRCHGIVDDFGVECRHFGGTLRGADDLEVGDFADAQFKESAAGDAGLIADVFIN